MLSVTGFDLDSDIKRVKTSKGRYPPALRWAQSSAALVCGRVSATGVACARHVRRRVLHRQGRLCYLAAAVSPRREKASFSPSTRAVTVAVREDDLPARACCRGGEAQYSDHRALQHRRWLRRRVIPRCVPCATAISRPARSGVYRADDGDYLASLSLLATLPRPSWSKASPSLIPLVTC